MFFKSTQCLGPWEGSFALCLLLFFERRLHTHGLCTVHSDLPVLANAAALTTYHRFRAAHKLCVLSHDSVWCVKTPVGSAGFFTFSDKTNKGWVVIPLENHSENPFPSVPWRRGRGIRAVAEFQDHKAEIPVSLLCHQGCPWDLQGDGLCES